MVISYDNNSYFFVFCQCNITSYNGLSYCAMCNELKMWSDFVNQVVIQLILFVTTSSYYLADFLCGAAHPSQKHFFQNSQDKKKPQKT